MSGDIHWKVSLLKNEASYSLEVLRSFAIGGSEPHLKGLNPFLYHGFLLVTGSSSSLSKSVVALKAVDRVVVLLKLSGLLLFSVDFAAKVLSLSDTDCSLSLLTYSRGRIPFVAGSDWLTLLAATSGSVTRHFSGAASDILTGNSVTRSSRELELKVSHPAAIDK